MRILSLSFDGYKMFNPSPKFRLGKDVQIFIGVNGSGKSSVVEIIATLFSEVKKYCTDGKSREPKFHFAIEYTFVNSNVIEGTSTSQETVTTIHHVILTSAKENSLEYTMSVDDELIGTWQEMYKFLPDNLIFYYAGFGNTLEKIVQQEEQATADKLYNIKTRDEITNVVHEFSKNFVYIRKDHFPILFILNYIEDQTSLPLSGKEFTIYNIRFQFQKPRKFGNDDYANFYNIQGFLRNYLQNLVRHSQTIEEIKQGRKRTGSSLIVEYHRGIIEAVEDLPNIPVNERFENTRYLAFHLINLLFNIGILKEIDVSIRDANGNIYSINDLSEGEQQLVTVEAINKILCKDNTVLFFDEPDAFLHPQRQRELVPHLVKQFGNRFSNEFSQLIITTHSPFVAQSQDLDSIILFGKNGKIMPVPDEKIASYSAITDELFGVKSEFSIEVENDLAHLRQIRSKVLNDQDYSIIELKALVNKLHANGDEIIAIVNRELNQLQKLKGDIF